MKTCFGYVRVSTAKQGDGVSLEAQQEAIQAFASRNGIIISKWFEERETAAKKGRPIFNRMIAELHRRKADGVVIHKIDRSERNFADWARIGDLADAGIDIHFANECLDFRSRGGRLTADIQAVIAADYVRNLREETIKGMKGRLKQGLYPFKAPIGYLDNGGGQPKTIDPLTAPMVREVFERYATGNYSLHSLTAAMCQTNHRKACGKPLTKSNIAKMLINPFYMGLIRIQRTGDIYQGAHEPIIPVALYESAEAVRNGRDNKKSTRHDFVFRGLFRCGYCTGAMIGELQKGNVYYRCHQKDCTTKSIREDALLVQTLGYLERFTLKEEQVEFLRERFAKSLNLQSKAKTRKAMEFELKKIEARLSKLTDKLIDGIVSDDVFQAKKTDLILEQRRLQEILKSRERLGAQMGQIDKFLELAKSLSLLCLSASNDQKRELLIFATSNRKIYKKDLEIEPSDWLSCLQDQLAVPVGDPDSDASRTFLDSIACVDNLAQQIFHFGIDEPLSQNAEC